MATHKVYVPIALSTLLVLGSVSAWRLNHPPLSPREERSVATAMRYLSRGNYSLAISRARRTLSLNPDNTQAADIYNMLAVLGYPVKRLPADEAFVNALALYPKYENAAWMNMIIGEQARKMDLVHEAIDYHLNANALDDGIPHNWFLLGLAHRKAGQQVQALAALQHAHSLFSHVKYEYEVGQQQLFMGQYDVAYESFSHIVTEQPYRITAKIGKIRALIKLGKKASALEQADEMRRLLASGTREVRKHSRRIVLLKAGDRFRVAKNPGAEDLMEYVNRLITSLENHGAGSVSTDSPAVLSVDLQQVLEFDLQGNP